MSQFANVPMKKLENVKMRNCRKMNMLAGLSCIAWATGSACLSSSRIWAYLFGGCFQGNGYCTILYNKLSVFVHLGFIFLLKCLSIRPFSFGIVIDNFFRFPGK